ncbi:hypothetical protein H663_020055, partial [Limnohabitans planktonicus II-D5]
MDNGTLSALSSTDGGKTWVGTFTPTPGVADATNTVSLTNSYTDVAGNQGTSAQSANYVMDLKAPSATIALSDSALKMGETATVTITFSEKVLGFSLADVSAPNGSLSAFTASADGLSWTATFTPADQTTAASNTLTLANSYTDESGNTGSGATATYAIDTQAPSFTAKLDDASNSGSLSDLLTNDATPTISGTGTAGDTVAVTLPGTGEVLSATVAANGSWSVTPTLAIVSGNVNITASDAAGNVSSAQTLALVVDSTIATPTLSLVCDSGASSTDKISRDGTISVSADSGSVLEYSTNGTSWTTTFVAAEGANTVQVRATDAAGNVATSSAMNFTLDTQTPAFTVALVCDSGALATDSISKAPALAVTGAEAGAVIEYSSNGTVWASTYAATEGANSVQVRVTDTAGNQRAQSSSFTLDSTAPTAPVLTLVCDSGSNATDKLSRNGLISVAAEAGATLEFSTNGSTWASTFAAAEGANTVMARVTDAAGNISQPSSLSFTLDSTAPVAPTVGLFCDSGTATGAGTDKVSNNGTLSLSSPEAGGLIEYSTNGVLWATTFVAAEGNNAVKVRVTDAAGNLGATADYSFTLDTTAPGSPVLTLTCDSGASATDLISSDGALSVTAEAGATLQYSTDGTSWASTFAAAEGNNTVKVRAVDAAGNTGPASNLGFTLDKTIATPTLTLVCDSGASAVDTITRNGAISVNAETGASLQYSTNGSSWATTFAAIEGTNTVQVRATDAASNVATSTPLSFTLDTQTPAFTVALVCDSGASGADSISKSSALVVTGAETGATVEYSSNGTVWASTYAATEGANSVQVRVTDTAGNQRAQSFSFTLDSTAPTAPVLTLICDSGSNATDKLSRNGLISVAAEAGATLEYSTNGSTWASTFAAAEGANTVMARVTDAAGNISQPSSLSFTLDSTAPVAPTVGLFCDSGTSAGASTDKVSNNGTLSLSSPEAGGLIEYSTNGVLWANTFVAAEGNNAVKIRITDAAGNVGATADYSFTLDTTAPGAPVLTLTCDSGASATDLISSDGALSVTAEAGATLQYSTDGSSWASTFAAAEGNNTVKVRAVDAAGNTGPASNLAFTLDKTIATPTLSLVCDSGASAVDTITRNGAISVNAETGASLQYSTNGSSWATTFAAIEGTNTVQVRATDAAGNVATSAPLSFTLDTQTPAFTVALVCDSGASGADSISKSSALVVTGAETGATVEYSSNGTVWASTYAASEGLNNVKVRVSDAAGNQRTQDFSFTLDSTAPTAPVLTLVCDSGSNATDKLSRNGLISVAAEAGATLEFSTNGSTWASTFAAAEGANTIMARVTDAAGNISQPSSLSFTLDSTAPVAPTVGLFCDSGTATGAATDKVSNNGTLSLSSPEAGGLIEYSTNGVLWTNTFVAAEGNNAVKIRITDAAGNLGATADYSFTLDTTAPGAPVLTLTCDSGASATDLISSDGALSVTAEAGATLQYSTDGTSWASTFAAAEGNNTIKVRAVDAAGNTGPASNLAFTLDKTIATPTLTLVCDSGASSTDKLSRDGTISVSADSGSVQEYSTNGTSWTTTFVAAEGTNTVQVRATDAAGNVATSAPLSFTLDTQTPAFTVALVCDSGALATDSISNAPALVVTRAEAGAVIEYSSNGTVWASTYAASEGINSVKVRVSDAAGNQRTQDFSFTLDSTAPTAPVLTLVCDSGSNATDKLSGNGAISVAAEAGATLEFSTNGSTWTSTFAAAEGANTVMARVTDAAGNVSQPSSLSFTLDSTAPVAPTVGLFCDSGTATGAATDKVSNNGTLSLSSPEAGGLIEYSTNGVIWATTFVAAEGNNAVKVRVTDAAGNVGATADYSFTLDTTAPGAPVVTLTCDSGASATDLISSNGALSVTAEAGATLQYSTDGTSWASTFAAAEGNNTVKVRAIDAAGNAGPASSLGFTLDKTIATPTLTLVCDSGTSATDAITRNGAISANAEAGAALEYSTNGTAWTTTFTAVEGANTVTVRATDAAGNVASSAPLSFSLNTQGAAFTAKLDDASNSGSTADLLTSDSTPTISGTGTAGNTIQVTMPGTLEVLSATVAANGSWSVTPTLAIVSGNVSITASDAAGNVSSAQTLALVVDSSIATPTLSLVCDSGASSTDKISRDGTLSVSADSGSVLEYSTNGTSWTTTFVAAEGANTVQVRATDAAGNVATSSAMTFTLDTQTPAFSVALVSDSGALATDGISNAPALVVTGAEAGATLEYSNNNSTTGTVWASTYAATEGVNNVQVRVTDTAGNQRAQSFSFTLDSTAPTAPIITLVCDSGSSATDRLSRNGLISVTAEAGATLEFSTNGSTWTTTFAAAEGANTVMARVTDAAGNVSSSSSLSFTLDSTAPVAPTVGLFCDSGTATGTATDKVSNNGTLSLSSPEAGGLIEYSTNGVLWATTFVAAEGNNAVKIRITDAAGNVGATADYSFTLDSTAPGAPVVTLACDSGALGTDQISQNGTLTVSLPDTALALEYSTNGSSWTSTFAAGEGNNTVKVRAVDAAGNLSAVSTLNFTVDKTIHKPVVTLGCDTGIVGDTITSLGEISVSNADSDAQVRYSRDNVSWSTTFAAAEGSNTVYVRVNDAAGNVSTSDALNFYLNTRAGTFTARLDNASNSGSLSDSLTHDDTPSISGSGKEGATVEVTMPAPLDGSAAEVFLTTVDVNGMWSVTAGKPIASGTVTVVYTEPNSAVSSSASISILIDKDISTPVLSLVCDTGSSASDKISQVGSLGLAGVDAGVTIEFSTDGTVWTSTYSAAEGANTVRARVLDGAGNVATSNVLNFTLDTTAATPTLNVNAVTGDDAIGPLDASQASTILSGTSTLTQAGDLVTLGLNGQTYSGTVDAFGNYSIAVDTQDLVDDADHKIDARVTGVDLAGNTGTVTVGHLYSVDAVAPSVQSLVLDKPSLKAGETAQVTLTFSEKVTAFDLADLSADNAVLSQLASADGGLTWTATLTPTAAIEDTTNVVKVLATYTDLAGNTGLTAQSSNYSLDTLAPSFTLQLDNASNSGSLGDTLTNDSTPTLSGTGNTGDTLKVTMPATGEVVSATVAADGTWRATLTQAITSGTVSVIATDAVGNTSAAQTLSLQIDTSLPGNLSLALVCDSGTSSSDKITRTGDVTVTGQDADTTVQYSTDGSTWATTFAATEGLNTLRVRQMDAAGNVSATSTLAFTLDTTAPVPTLSINPITGDDAIGPVDAASTTTKISGTSTGARPGDVITLVLNGVSYTGTVDVVGEY